MRSPWLTLLAGLALLQALSCARPQGPVSQQPASPATPAISGAARQPMATATSGLAAQTGPSATAEPAVQPATASPQGTLQTMDPFTLISQDSLFGYLEDLTSIQSYSGWRNSATEGEREALDYVGKKLAELEHLHGLGLEVERQYFRVFLATELWESQVNLTIGGREIEVPADGLRGSRDDIPQALHFDSDGKLNDSASNPVVVEGPVVLIRSAEEIRALDPAGVRGKVVFVDYAAIDPAIHARQTAEGITSDLVSKGMAGLVLVTQFSTRQGESHGAFVGDGTAFQTLEARSVPPILYVRLEDLVPAGIQGWEDLARVEAARLTWDADVFSPAASGNLVARIPGADPSRAVILGAHIDSPNSPGAMDDGSGSAILLEVARVVDAARIRPPTDLVLVWFGSEELHLFGSYHFAATHQELLDRAVAMLQIDCLTRPLDGIDAHLNLVAWSYGRLGDSRLTWPDYLAKVSGRQGVNPEPVNYYGVESDNSAFAGFDVPNANLIYVNAPAMEAAGGIHHAGHIHGPYDTVALAREMSDVLAQMARVALTAALDTGHDAPTLRVTPRRVGRIVFVASHTEAVHMAPTTFTDMGMALAMDGFDVDLVPYGQPVTPADLADASLVVALPVVDYPSQAGDSGQYDEAWTPAELAALEQYVAGGGLLVLTNSRHRFKWATDPLELNEDWADANALAERFGITYQEDQVAGRQAQTEGDNPLVEGVSSLALIEDNAVPFTLTRGQVLARANGQAAAALMDHGDKGGQVLILADIGILAADWDGPDNLPFWQNLARYVRAR